MRRNRRVFKAQASAISVAILVSATLILSLLLYSYYSSMYAELNKKSQIELYRMKYLSNVDSVVIYSWKNITTTNNLICYIIKFINNGDYPVIIRYTLMPLIQQPNSIIPSSLIYKIPIDQSNNIRTVHIFYVEDVNGNGIADLVGNNNTTLAVDRIPNCSELLDLNNGYTANSVKPSIQAPSGAIIFNNEIPLSVLVKNLTFIPIWETAMDVGKTKHILVGINATVPVTELNLVLFVRIDYNYLVAEAIELP